MIVVQSALEILSFLAEVLVATGTAVKHLAYLNISGSSPCLL